MESSHFQKCSVHETNSAPINVNRNFTMHSRVTQWLLKPWYHGTFLYSMFTEEKKKTPSLSSWLRVMHSHIYVYLYIYTHFRNVRSQQCKNWEGCEFKVINNSYADPIWKHLEDNNSNPQWGNNFNTYFLRFEWIKLNWNALFFLALKKEKKQIKKIVLHAYIICINANSILCLKLYL